MIAALDAWRAAIARLPAKAFANLPGAPTRLPADEIIDVMLGTPEGYLAASARALCRASVEDDDLAAAMGVALSRYSGFRGPRTSALTAMLSSGIQLDDATKTLTPPPVDHDEWFLARRSGWESGQGIVASVKVDAAKATIAFKPKMEKQIQCAETRTTNQMTRIEPNGDVRYLVVCVKNKTVVVNTASDPQLVDARYLAGVKPGVFVRTARGIVTGVWGKPTSPVAAVVLGVPVK